MSLEPRRLHTLAGGLALVLAACAPAGPGDAPPAGQAAAAGEAAAAAGAAADIHSHARPGEVRVTHMNLDWDVDFDARRLRGTAVLHLQRLAASAPLRLDSRGLDLESVTAGRRGEEAAGWQAAVWRHGAEDERLGTEIIIDLAAGADAVRIVYATRPDASGLQWLEPSQTAGGQHPFLYSQSQAIHARSWIPCQDSPAVRVTFDAAIRSPQELTPVMAARRTGPGTFTMPHPIPPYLLALAVGDLAFREAGPRTGVWAEPTVLEKAVWEFADMERMLEATEALYGPYRWERYDLLVLPPSFPFGGMENPMLTFATPSVLAGDRSLVSLVAHELAHSWSGNLVTNATWSDFWLNEGFTTYIERRIMEAVYGLSRAEMEWMLGRQDLDDERAALPPADQILYVDLAGRDPDDGMTDIPYEKGALFLRLLEETYGRPVFDAFLRRWFDDHAFTSVTTSDLVAAVGHGLLAAAEPLPGHAAPDLEVWIHTPGLPGTAPVFVSGQLTMVDAAVAAWTSGARAAGSLETGNWTTQQWLHFLRTMPADLNATRLAQLDAAFAFTASGNSEIVDEWLVLAIRHGYAAADQRLQQFLTSTGRRKFLTPLYRELMQTAEGAARAREIYREARPLYHAISRRTLDALVTEVAAGS